MRTSSQRENISYREKLDPDNGSHNNAGSAQHLNC